jgi:hypothetical protein
MNDHVHLPTVLKVLMSEISNLNLNHDETLQKTSQNAGMKAALVSILKMQQ